MVTRPISTTQVRPITTIYDFHFSLIEKPDTSEESKQHSKEILDQEFNGGNIEKDSGEKNPQNVAGGLKA